MDTLRQNTLLLEDSRDEMVRLAASTDGDEALLAVISQAEMQIRTNTRELEQARKKIELTIKQQTAVAATRNSTESKLIQSRQDEDDARLTLDTVRRMIDDANIVRSKASADTARILEKAGSVLGDTLCRAEASCQEKKALRQELEAALVRLEATEKAVQYSMARDERAICEKALAKLIAERKYEVCAAQMNTIHLEQERTLLQGRKATEDDAADVLQGELAAAEQNLLEKWDAIEKLEADSKQAAAGVQSDLDADLAEMDARLVQQQEEKVSAEAHLESLTVDAAALLQEVEEIEHQNAAQAEADAQTVAAMKMTLQNAKEEAEAALSKLEQELEQKKNAGESASESLANAREAAEALRQKLAECENNLEEARTEEQTARDAMATATRLADNAISIRQNINSESSALLLHAQEVLTEAASAAEELLQEKNAVCKEVEMACMDLRSRTSAAQQGIEELAQLSDAAWADYQDFRQKLDVEREEKEKYLRDLEDNLAGKEAAVSVAALQAEELLMQKKTASEEAGKATETAKAALDALVLAISGTEEERRNIAAAGAVRLQEILSHLEAEKQQLLAEVDAAEAVIADLRNENENKRNVIHNLAVEIERVTDLEQSARTKVDEIIAAGAMDISSAVDDVNGHYAREEATRQAAEVAMRASNELDEAERLRNEEALTAAADLDDSILSEDDLAVLAYDIVPAELEALQPENMPESEVFTALDAEITDESKELSAEASIDEVKDSLPVMETSLYSEEPEDLSEELLAAEEITEAAVEEPVDEVLAEIAEENQEEAIMEAVAVEEAFAAEESLSEASTVEADAADEPTELLADEPEAEAFAASETEEIADEEPAEVGESVAEADEEALSAEAAVEEPVKEETCTEEAAAEDCAEETIAEEEAENMISANEEFSAIFIAAKQPEPSAFREQTGARYQDIDSLLDEADSLLRDEDSFTSIGTRDGAVPDLAALTELLAEYPLPDMPGEEEHEPLFAELSGMSAEEILYNQELMEMSDEMLAGGDENTQGDIDGQEAVPAEEEQLRSSILNSVDQKKATPKPKKRRFHFF